MIVFDSSERLVGLLEAVCQSSRNRARRFPFVLRACAAISPTTPLTPPGLRAFGEVPPRPTSKRFQDSIFFASMMGGHLLSLRIPRRPQRKWVEKPLCRWSPLPPLAGREASSIDSSSSLRAQNPPQSEATLAPASNQPPKHPQQLPCRSEFVLPSKQIQLYTVFVGKRLCDRNPEQWVASAAWRQTPPNCALRLPEDLFLSLI